MNSNKILSSFVLSLFLSLLLGPSTWAQANMRYEFSAGYSFQHINTEAGVFGLQGVHVSVTRNINRWLGITGDFGGYHAEGFRLGTYVFGPRVTHHVGKTVTVFGQALFGGVYANAGARGLPSYHEGFATAFGGGADYAISERFSIRLVQAEYQQTHLGGKTQNAARITTGVVFQWGQ